MLIYQEIYNFIAMHLDLFRFFYSIFIAFICLIIVIKTDRMFRISEHQGIRYFRNAFFFYGIAFMLRYLLTKPMYFMLTRVFFEFFMIMAGFFLLYSLIWRKFEDKGSRSSFFNPFIFLFYFFTIVIILLDYFWEAYNFMFFSQIIIFGFASIISFKNYLKKSKTHKFTRLYFVIMILSFFAWSFNFIFMNFSIFSRLRWLANVYVLNIIVFLIFLYGVIKLTRKSKGF